MSKEKQIIKPDKKLITKQITIILIYAIVLPIIFLLPMAIVELSLQNIDFQMFTLTGWIIVLSITFGVDIILVMLAYIFIKKRVESISYTISKNSVEITSGVFQQSTRTITFEKIINVQKRQGILDRKFSIGTVYLVTAAVSGSSAVSAHFIGIKEYDEIYEQMSQLIEK